MNEDFKLFPGFNFFFFFSKQQMFIECLLCARHCSRTPLQKEKKNKTKKIEAENKTRNASQICVSSSCRGHTNLLCIIPVFSVCAAELSTLGFNF